MSAALNGLPQFNAEVKKWFAAVEREAAKAATGLAKQVFEKVLEESPQNSGDFVANWKVSVGAPVDTFEPGVLSRKYSSHKGEDGIGDFVRFKRGDAEAMDYARAHAQWKVPKLGQSIFISNSAEHDERYAWQIEKGLIKFRPVNAGAGAAGRRSVEFVQRSFATITRPQFDILRKIGT